MPPRIRCPSAPLASVDALSAHQPRTTSPFYRTFSSTPCHQKVSLGRRRLFAWLKTTNGRMARDSTEPGMVYLGALADQPFPLNPLFRSQPVLADNTKELIWDRITQRGESFKAVSADMNIAVDRVVAVVRLKVLEKQWETDGKKLAVPYARAVMGMLPKSKFFEGEQNVPHEAINEVHVHKLTMGQLFVPVPESREFNREDAAKAFHENMLSADVRSPQAELIQMEREILGGKGREESMARFKERAQKQEDATAKKVAKEREHEENQTTRIKTDRYEFRFKEINVDDAGRKGWSGKATGWRYGAPLNDRKRGLVKIPKSVP